jgi:hypothetical protein
MTFTIEFRHVPNWASNAPICMNPPQRTSLNAHSIEHARRLFWELEMVKNAEFVHDYIEILDIYKVSI